jgi:16S rRNA (uracil1498-N3)-methyltransferase
VVGAPILGRQRLVIAPEQVHQQELRLSPQQNHYLYRVLRLQSGQQFIALIQGEWWLTELRAEGAPAQRLEQLHPQTELPTPVTLMAALPKGNGFEGVISQATELGVSNIVPLLSERTLLQPSANKLDRWQRLAQEAAEQSLRQVVPTLHPPVGFKEATQALSKEDGRAAYLCVLDATAPHLGHVLDPRNNQITILTGPEGGWSPAEQALALSLGITPVSLGARVLRAVTAPLAALAIIAAKLEGA